MPIVIKELFPSDPISEALEKINFNFDQLLLAGGGPPGIQGNTGPAGVPGPQGDRGDHWQVGGASALSYTGPTSDHGPGFGALQDTDHWVDSTGEVWEWQAGPTNSWIDTGVNLVGPMGPAGVTGGSYEFGLYLGQTGNAIDPNDWGPAIGPTTISPSNPLYNNHNFIIPNNAIHWNLFLGDRDWAYNQLKSFNTIDLGTSGVNGTFQTVTPKLSIIQRRPTTDGFGGLAIGAYGLTGATGPGGSYPQFQAGSTGDIVDARDMFYAGIAVRNFVEGATSTLSHVFRARTNTIDFEIQAGDTDPLISSGKKPAIRLTADSEIFRNFNSSRIIESSTIPSAITGFDNRIQINSVPTITEANGYVSLQNAVSGITPSGLDHQYSSVIIGATSVPSDPTKLWALQPGGALKIVRPVNNYSGNVDSHISLFGINTNATTPILKIIGFETAVTGALPTTQLAGRRIGINQAIGTNDTLFSPKFPFHVNQQLANLSLNPEWTNSPALTNVNRWVSGFDSYNTSYSRIIPSTTRDLQPSAGVGVGYGPERIFNSGEDNINYYFRDIVLNTYWTGDQSTASAYAPWYQLKNPDLYLQVNGTTTEAVQTGNLGLGFISDYISGGAGSRRANSKLSINGSITVGSTANGYHDAQTASSIDSRLATANGIWAEGRIIRGGTKAAIARTYFFTDAQTQLIFGASSSFGIASKDRTIAGSFIAAGYSGGSPTTGFRELDPHFSLPDLRTGMYLYAIGDSRFSVNANGATATLPGVPALDNFRSANSNDGAVQGQYGKYPTSFGATSSPTYRSPGVQTYGTMAFKPLQIFARNCSNYIQAVPGGSDKKGIYAVGCNFVIPCTTSTVSFVGSGYVSGPYGRPSGSPLNPPTTASVDWYTAALQITGIQSWPFATAGFGNQYPLSCYIEPGRYEGQLLTISSMGWTGFPLVLCNNARRGRRSGNNPGASTTDQYSDYHALALETTLGPSGAYTGAPGGTGQDTTNIGKQAPTSLLLWSDQSAPYPFPAGASGLTPNNASVARAGWSESGQFTIRDYRTITLQWLPFYDPEIVSPIATIVTPTWRWVEISRQHLNYRSDNGSTTTIPAVIPR